VTLRDSMATVVWLWRLVWSSVGIKRFYVRHL